MKRDHAIVVGTGLSGLLAAKVLSEYFHKVSVIERDSREECQDHRKGAPQAHHGHALLRRGYLIITKFFPGIEADLETAGGEKYEFIKGTLIFSGSWMPKFSTGLFGHINSRVILERTIRKRLEAIKNINFKYESKVIGLKTNSDRTKVTGIDFEDISDNKALKSLDADLVVIAAGRTVSFSEWLAKLDIQIPAPTIIKTQDGYASREYKLNSIPDWKIHFVFPQKPGDCGGSIFKIEGSNNFMFTLYGKGDNLPPADEAGFSNFASKTKGFDKLLAGAKPLSNIFIWRKLENVAHRLFSIKNWPSQLVVVGDCAIRLHPALGQGMTLAAIGAEHLDIHLAKKIDKKDKRWEQSLHKSIFSEARSAWFISTRTELEFSAEIQNGFYSGSVRSIRQAIQGKILGWVAQSLPFDRTIYFHQAKINALLMPFSAIYSWHIVLRALYISSTTKYLKRVPLNNGSENIEAKAPVESPQTKKSA